MVRVPGCFNQESYLSDCSTDFESSSREGKIYEGILIGRQDLNCEFGQSTYASLEEAPVNTGYQDPMIKDCLAFHSKREDPHQKLVRSNDFLSSYDFERVLIACCNAEIFSRR